MHFDLRQSLRMAIATVLVALFIVPTEALAQSHVVSPADLQKAATAVSQVRQHNLDSIQRLLSTPTAEKALKSAKMGHLPVDPDDVYSKYEAAPPEWFWIEH